MAARWETAAINFEDLVSPFFDFAELGNIFSDLLPLVPFPDLLFPDLPVGAGVGLSVSSAGVGGFKIDTSLVGEDVIGMSDVAVGGLASTVGEDVIGISDVAVGGFASPTVDEDVPCSSFSG